MTAKRKQDSQFKTTAIVAAIAVRSQGNGVPEFIDYMDGMGETPLSRWWIRNCENDGKNSFASKLWAIASNDNPKPKRIERKPLEVIPQTQCSSMSGSNYLIKGLIAEGDMGCINGQPGHGKSVLAPKIALAIARGSPIFGLKVKQAAVGYIASEDGPGMERRFLALAKNDGSTDQLSLIKGITDLKDPDQVSELIEVVKKLKLKVLVIDTLNIACPGNENEAEHMSSVVQFGKTMSDLGVATIFIHHPAKDPSGVATPRGHGSFNGALDFCLIVELGDDNIIRGTLTKNRNGHLDINIAARIESVEVGTDCDGDPITAPYAVECHPRTVSTIKLNKSQTAALDILTELFADTKGGFGGVLKVSLHDWREACVASRKVSAAKEAKDRSSRFSAILSDLCNLGVVTTRGDFAVRQSTCLLPDLDAGGAYE